MSRKQWSWRCSNQALSLVLLFSISKIFSMESESIYGVRYKDIDKAWETAPVAIKNWAEELKECDGSFKSLPYRLFLHGIPGAGKTILGLGIWKQNNPEWELEPICAGDLISKHRGEAGEKLREVFKKINPDRKTILLLDEAHVLMEGASRESTHTSETTEVLRSFLGAHAENRNFMAILTGNNVEDMKDSMASRLFLRGIEILPPSPEELSAMFQYYLQDEGFDVRQIDANSLIAVNKAAGARVGRDVKSFATLIKEEVRDDGYRGKLDQYCLQQALLLKKAALYKEKAKKFKIGEKKLSDRELQQELHDDGKWHQTKLAGAAIAVPVAIAAVAGSKEAYSYYQKSKTAVSLASVGVSQGSSAIGASSLAGAGSLSSSLAIGLASTGGISSVGGAAAVLGIINPVVAVGVGGAVLTKMACDVCISETIDDLEEKNE